MATILIIKAAGLTLAANYGVHTAAAMAYDYVCVPHSIWDIPYSIVATASPVCTFLVSTIHLTQTNFATVLSTTVAAALVGVLKPG